MGLSKCHTTLAVMRHLNSHGCRPIGKVLQIGFSSDLDATIKFYHRKRYSGTFYYTPSQNLDRDYKSVIGDFYKKNKRGPYYQFENENENENEGESKKKGEGNETNGAKENIIYLIVGKKL